MTDGILPVPPTPEPGIEAEVTFRAIERLEFQPPLVFQPIPTDKPMLEWVVPSELLVDETYQRDLSKGGRELIRKIAERFDWRRFKPPIVAWTERGYEVVDGQHTALGAVLRQDIEKIPVLLIIAEDVEDRATAFVGHNTDRLNVTPLQLHHARVAAKDRHALAVERACAEAGASLVHNYHGHYVWKTGDTIAARAVSGLVQRRGVEKAVEILRVLVQADMPPIQSAQIKALEYVYFIDPYYFDRLPPLPEGREAVVKAIRALGREVVHEAQVKAKQEKITAFKALGMIWFSKFTHRKG
jgi:hypothetical protein